VNPDWYPRSALRRLLGSILTPGPSPAAYILRNWPLQIVPSVLLVAAAFLIARFVGHPLPAMPPTKASFLSLVVVAPILETLMMVPVLWLLRRMLSSRLTAAVISAVLWAALHAMQSPGQGVGVVWGFFVMSSAFLGWRERSLLAAFWVTASLHALNNFTVWTLVSGLRSGGSRGGWFALVNIVALMACGVALARSLTSRLPPGEVPAPALGAKDAVVPAVPAVDPLPVNLARASWVLPIVGMAAAVWLEHAVGKGPAPDAVVFLLAPTLSFLAGVAALVWIPWSGTRKILAPALTGLLLNAVILLGALVVFLVRYNRGLSALHE
jgi:hypothetical protein